MVFFPTHFFSSFFKYELLPVQQVCGVDATSCPFGLHGGAKCSVMKRRTPDRDRRGFLHRECQSFVVYGGRHALKASFRTHEGHRQTTPTYGPFPPSGPVWFKAYVSCVSLASVHPVLLVVMKNPSLFRDLDHLAQISNKN